MAYEQGLYWYLSWEAKGGTRAGLKFKQSTTYKGALSNRDT